MDNKCCLVVQILAHMQCNMSPTTKECNSFDKVNNNFVWLDNDDDGDDARAT